MLTKPSDLYVVKTMMHVNRQINKLYNLNDLKKKKINKCKRFYSTANERKDFDLR